MRRSVRIVLIALGCCIAPHVAGQVYRCTEGGKTVYSDRPCGADAKTLTIAPDPNSPARGNMVPKTKLTVAATAFDACWEGFRRYARDPTTAKRLGHFAEVADDGLPYIYVTAVFTNKMGGPNRRFVRCRLNDDLTINQAVVDEDHKTFFRSQMDQ